MAKSGFPLPGRSQAISGPPPAPEEQGESYDITPDELAQLNEQKTVTCGNGVTINVKDGAMEDSAPPDPDSMNGDSATTA